MYLDLTATLIGLAVCIALIAFGAWRGSRPADPLKPRLIPWTLIAVISAGPALLLLVHVINLLGYETGRGRPF